MFKLTEEEALKIIIVVSKTKKGFCNEIPSLLTDWSNYESSKSTNYDSNVGSNIELGKRPNLIFEAMKSNQIKILPFEIPENESHLNEYNRAVFMENLNNTDWIDCINLRQRIKERIESKLLSLREEYKENPDIVFTSKITNKKEFNSDNILCIDNNLTLTQEFLMINAPKIVVLSKGDKKLFWEIKGKNPVIQFSENIKQFIFCKNLVISTKNSQDLIELEKPTSGNFSSSWEIFRLESICVNGKWTKYATKNNKFIDLIVILNPAFGKINVNPDFKIKTITIDLRLKFHINETLSNKKQMIEEFVSIRSCKNIDEYLKKCNKTNIKDNIKQALIDYVLKLPSIFHLVMKYSDFKSFFSNSSPDSDLLKIKRVLIKNYLKLIEDIISKEKETSNFNKVIHAYSLFENFCTLKLGPGFGKISPENKKLFYSLESVLNKNMDDGEILNFFSFFDTLSISEDKTILFTYELTGDISMYPNFKSLIQKTLKIGMSFDEFKQRYFNHETRLLHTENLTHGYNEGMSIIKKLTSSGFTKAKAVATFLAGGLILFTAGAAVDKVCASINSGYFNGEFTLDREFLVSIISLIS